MTGGMKVGIAVLLVALLTLGSSPVQAATTTTITQSTTTIYCPTLPAQEYHIGFGNSSIYENFDVESWVAICGEQTQYSQVHVALTTAWINNPQLQSAANLTFSFQDAYAWSPQTKCNLIGAAIEPAVSLHLIQQAIPAQNGQSYKPPAYGGQADLCFQYAGSYVPIFAAFFSNGTSVTLHQAPSQNPGFLLNISGAPSSTTTVTSTTIFTLTVKVPQPPGSNQTSPAEQFVDSPETRLVSAIWGSWLGLFGFLIVVAIFAFAWSKKGFRNAVKERFKQL